MNITPHKGGRTERIYARLTPEEKAMVWQAKGDQSLADWIVEQAEKDLRVNGRMR